MQRLLAWRHGDRVASLIATELNYIHSAIPPPPHPYTFEATELTIKEIL